MRASGSGSGSESVRCSGSGSDNVAGSGDSTISFSVSSSRKETDLSMGETTPKEAVTTGRYPQLRRSDQSPTSDCLKTSS